MGRKNQVEGHKRKMTEIHGIVEHRQELQYNAGNDTQAHIYGAKQTKVR